MHSIERMKRSRRRLRRALWCTTPTAILLLGISVVNGHRQYEPSPMTGQQSGTSTRMIPRSSVSGGNGGGDAWSRVSTTLSTQTGVAGGIGSIFSRKGHFERAPTEKLNTFDVQEPQLITTVQGPTQVAPSAPIVSSLGTPSAPIPAGVDGTPNQAERSSGDVAVRSQPISTFAVDVDTSSYSRMRQIVLQGQRPAEQDVRVEEMINYFHYDLPTAPAAGTPFSVTTDVVKTPWNQATMLLRVALNGHVVAKTARPPANIVLLVDVSGSMDADNKLGLIKRSFSDMVDHLGPNDRVSIVTYADGTEVKLPSTSNRGRIKAALSALSSGGGTNGAGGLAMAYDQARKARIRGGINRVMIASDGDFNVGTSDTTSLKAEIERQRDDGITLTTLGVGGQGGSGFNDNLMETLADAGNGNAVYLDDDLEARRVLRDQLESSIHMIAKDVKAQVEFNPAVIRSYRLIGYQNRRLAEAAFDNDKVDAGEIGSGHQVTALYEITPIGVTPSDVAAKRHFEANRIRNETNGGDDTSVIRMDTQGASQTDDGIFVKLRYKLPNGERSLLLQKTIPTSVIQAASEPSGDTAFAIAVAAFGSKLSGVQPGTFSADQIIALAGPQTDPQRMEFIDMVRQRGAAVLGYVAPARTVSVPQQQVEEYVPGVYVETNPPRTMGAWLALISGMLALWMFILDRRIAEASGIDQTSPQDPVGPKKDAEGSKSKTPGHAVDIMLLTKAIQSARIESTTDMQTHIAAFEFAAHRAVAAGVEDGDIADEVEALLNRHATGYLDQYVTARRRATTNQIGSLEESLRRTLETMTGRLRDLVEKQSTRDVDRMGEHETFIHSRHGEEEPAI